MGDLTCSPDGFICIFKGKLGGINHGFLLADNSFVRFSPLPPPSQDSKRFNIKCKANISLFTATSFLRKERGLLLDQIHGDMELVH